MIASGSERPASVRNSRALSNMAESVPSSSMMGRTRARSSPKTAERNSACRAFMALTLPLMVLISPLWVR